MGGLPHDFSTPASDYQGSDSGRVAGSALEVDSALSASLSSCSILIK